MGRDLVEVIGAMLDVLPASETDLGARLEAIQTSARYAAPEVMYRHWDRVSHLLKEAFGFPPSENWQKSVAAIFIGDAPPGAG